MHGIKNDQKLSKVKGKLFQVKNLGEQRFQIVFTSDF